MYSRTASRDRDDCDSEKRTESDATCANVSHAAGDRKTIQCTVAWMVYTSRVAEGV